MTDCKILMVVTYDPLCLPNQPFFHVVRYFSQKFQEVDYATRTNLYGGPPAPLLAKVKKSFHNLLHERTHVSQEGNVKHLVIRSLKLPHLSQIMFSDLWCIANLPGWLKENHYDVCFYCCPHNALLATWLQRSRIANKVVYYDVDYFPDHVDSHHALCRMALSWREQIAVRNADGVISVSKPLAQLRKSQGAKKVITVPNGVDLDRFITARDKEPHPPTLIYVGLLSEAWGVDLVLQALPRIKEQVPDVRFIIVGSGDYSNELERMTSQLGLDDRVMFMGRQPYNELAQYMRQADVAVATYKPRRFVEYASSMKIKDYLAAGLPVITTTSGDAERIIADSGAGVVIDHSPEAIAASAVKILANRQLTDDCAQAAIRYAPRLDWKVVLKPALDFVVSV